MNIILIGFKSAGKTTIGKLLAKALNKKFIDLDDKIADLYSQKEGKKLNPREIYIKLGDAGYRSLEKEATQALSKESTAVIATGGGTICNADNATILKKKGRLVYLNVPVETLRKRILNDESLAFLDANHPARQFEKTLSERAPIYSNLADLVINTENKAVGEIVTLIKEVYHGK